MARARRSEAQSLTLFSDLQQPKAPLKAVRGAMPKSQRIFNFIHDAGPNGATCEEIEKALHFSHQSVSARLYEAEAARKISPKMDDGVSIKRPTSSGKPAIVWVAVQS